MGTFKVTQLTNIRPAKGATVAEVETTPTSGTVKLNTLACEKLKIGNGDYATVVKGSIDDGAPKLYIAKGYAGSKKGVDGATEDKAQLGAKVSSTSGKNGGSMSFSSENAYNEMGGNPDSKRIFKLGEPVNAGDTTYYELIHDRDEAKVVRAKKA